MKTSPLTHWLPASIKPSNLAARRLKRLTHGRIFSGPFTGMHYVNGSVCSAWYPKILGTYELELHDLINKLSGKAFDTFVDVGAAEGYYAVGMSRLINCKKVIAFEATDSGQELIRELAELNDVSSIFEVRGFCSPQAFKAAITGASGSVLIICAIEGGEESLLLEQPISIFQNAVVIVETHEFAVRGVTEKLIHYFSATHEIDRIQSRERVAADIPRGLRSPIWNRWIVRLMGEERPMTMDWLLMTPRHAKFS